MTVNVQHGGPSQPIKGRRSGGGVGRSTSHQGEKSMRGPEMIEHNAAHRHNEPSRAGKRRSDEDGQLHSLAGEREDLSGPIYSLDPSTSRATPMSVTPSRSPHLSEASLGRSAGDSRHRAGSTSSSMTSSTRSKRRKPTMDQVINSPMEGLSRQSSVSSQMMPMRSNAQFVPTEQHAFQSMASIIAQLQPSSSDLKVAIDHANDNPQVSATGSVQAFAMIAGPSWTYFVKTTKILIGRSSDNELSREVLDEIDIDLNPAKTVSRKHAWIEYNSVTREWELELQGRNGVRLNGRPYKPPDRPILPSGTVFEVGGEEFVFCLPDHKLQPAKRKVTRASKASTQPVQARSASLATTSSSSSQQIPPDFPEEIKMAHAGGTQGITGTGLHDSPILINGIDYSPDYMAQHKPPVSYSAIISMAIRAKANGRSTLSDIYEFISRNFAFFRHSDKSGWQNSVRHNLSLSAAFTKVPRESTEPGKGMKWIITPGLEDRVDPRTVRIGAPWFQINLTAENIGNGTARRQEGNGHPVIPNGQMTAQDPDLDQAQNSGLAKGTMVGRDGREDSQGEDYDEDVLDDGSGAPSLEQTSIVVEQGGV